jgi:hypothetical protein
MDFSNEPLASFMKPMGRGRGIDYYYFDESEWRIVFADWLLSDHARPPAEVDGFEEAHGNAESLPIYLLSVETEWLAMIIYPSIQALYASQRCTEMRALLRKMNKYYETIPGWTEKTRPYEKYTMPVEMNLDNCRNF